MAAADGSSGNALLAAAAGFRDRIMVEWECQ
jgi:hypothetical protein